MNKMKIIIKFILLTFFSLIWFVLIQAEYEIITKPELRSECPLIQGVGCVYAFGLILLILSAIIIYLLYTIIKKFKKSI